MADSSPPKSSDPEATASEPPPDSEPEARSSDEGEEEPVPSSKGSDEGEEEPAPSSNGGEDGEPSSDKSSSGVPSGRLSLIELEPEPASIPGKRMPTKPPPPPAKRGSSPPKDDGRPLPEPAFKSLVPKPAVGQSLVPARKFPPETVGDVMTRKLIALTEQDTVENIQSGMQRFRFRHLPVVTKENKLIGLVTERDMMRAEAEAAAESDDQAGGLSKDTPVSDIMNRDILTTRPDTDLATAGKAILQKKIGCLPIILEDETLVGIVTASDFVKLVVQLLDKPKDAD
jgi:CBS domain-containing protein